MWPKNNAYAYPRVAKKKGNSNKHKIRLMGEVGMAVQKSIQTRVVGIIRYMLHPYRFSLKYPASLLHPSIVFMLYRALQVTCQRLEAWLSYVECHHGNASLNQLLQSNKGTT